MKKIIILLLICTCIFAQRKIKYGDFTPQLKSDLKDTTKSIVSDSILSSITEVTKYGAIANDGIDDHAEIQNAYNSGIGTVIIGNSITDTFDVNIPTYATSNLKIIVNGHLKAMNAIIQALGEGVTSGTDSVIVTDGTAFSVGQWIMVTDTLQPLVGTSGQNRYYAQTNIISSINGDTLTVSDTWDYNYTVADLGSLATVTTPIIIEDVNNVTISGRGIIDGNKANGLNVEPIHPDGGEDIRIASIGCWDSNNITIENGLTIKNGLLHNIAFKTCDSIKVNKCIIDAAHDKNILLWIVNKAKISENDIINADYEDGVIMYADCENIHVVNNYVYNNGRFGIATDETDTSIVIANNILKDNGEGLFILGHNIKVVNNTVTGGGKWRYVATERGGIRLKNISDFTLLNCSADSMANGYYSLRIEAPDTPSKRVRIFGGTFGGNRGSTAPNTFGILAGANVSDLLIEACTVYNNDRGFRSETNAGTSDFRNVTFYGNTTNNMVFQGTTEDSVYVDPSCNFVDGIGARRFAGQDTIFIGNNNTGNIAHGHTVAPDIQDFKLYPLTQLYGASGLYIDLITSNNFRIYADSLGSGSFGGVSDTVVTRWTIDLNKRKFD
ncbi:MAG: right-handed parallel beta-helix repeat-containing protein [Candidatus Hodarchaeales archaeon]|jgi:hypothetical protein